jgi:hypothetical protein
MYIQPFMSEEERRATRAPIQPWAGEGDWRAPYVADMKRGGQMALKMCSEAEYNYMQDLAGIGVRLSSVRDGQLFAFIQMFAFPVGEPGIFRSLRRSPGQHGWVDADGKWHHAWGHERVIVLEE